MKKPYLFLVAVIIFVSGWAQSTGPIEDYHIEVLSLPYDTITADKSLYLDMLNGSPSNGFYQFPFIFPFDNSEYSAYEFDFNGIVTFPNAVDFQLFLFSGSYDVDLRQFQSGQLPNFLYSDYKYAEYLNPIPHIKIELRNIYNIDDVFNDVYTASFNLTYSFYANGVYEIHFGESNISSSATDYWIDNFGWTFLPGDAAGLYGPYLSAASLDNTRGFCLDGNLDNLVINRLELDDCDPITHYPSAGTLVRFTPPEVSNVQTSSQQYAIHTDRSSKTVWVESEIGITMSLDDLTGRTVASSNSRILSYGNIISGIYALNIISPYRRSTRLFVVD